MNKTIIKRIALFMAMLIGLECLPVEALAVENQTDTSTQTPVLDVNEEETPVEVVGELEDQRSAYTKSFRLSDGTISTVEYESDVHYKDENGEWQPIDNSLTFEDAQGNVGAEAEEASAAKEAAQNAETAVNVQQTQVSEENTEATENTEENKDQSTGEVSKDNSNGGSSVNQEQESTNEAQTQSELTENNDEDSIAVQSQSTDDVEETDGYKTGAGKVNFKFAKNANQKNLVRVTQGNYKLFISLQKKNKNAEITIGRKENIDSEKSISFDSSIAELGVGATFSNTSNTNDGSTTTFVRYGITILIVPVVVFVSSNATIAEA